MKEKSYIQKKNIEEIAEQELFYESNVTENTYVPTFYMSTRNLITRVYLNNSL